ncbi:phenylalanine--tRNA ligase subunit alpha [bacterium]|nr:phenylalanine--tRNA ligase subunit alpha [bacterium]
MEKKILVCLDRDSALSDTELIERTGLDEAQLRRAIGWLKTKEYIDIASELTELLVSLTEKGQDFAHKSTPEVRIMTELEQTNELPMTSITGNPDYESDDLAKAVGNLRKSGAITIEQGMVKLLDSQAAQQFRLINDFLRELSGQTRVQLDRLDPLKQEIARAGFHKRGKSKGIFWIDEQVRRTYRLSQRGLAIQALMNTTEVAFDEISQLTAAMLKDGSWKGKTFRKYNITLPSPRVIVGRKHPYREFLDLLKKKLISMGFEEMRGNIVENEFWNMDALFMPQFHSARDIHDVYFVKEPTLAQSIEEPFATNVARCHENGATTGSAGWRYTFDRERSRRLLLRSQGTVLSARTLAQKPKIPGKYFAIARCFRYDHIDATHAPDFYQIEGIVLGEDINFRHLLGLLKLFAEEVARSKEVKYLPAYFPFTEPSVEVHIKHERLGWMEMGGAGLFRPEVTKPLGVDVPVIAWGLGIDRMAMVALGIRDIRDLFSTDLDLIRSTVFSL